jgi:hypothetical protein
MYADALQVSMGAMTDSASNIANNSYTVEVYQQCSTRQVPGVLSPVTVNQIGQMSLGAPKGIYPAAAAGQTLPILAWADHVQFTILVRPVVTLANPLVSSFLSVVGLAYR